MTSISSEGRMIAEQVLNSADQFGAGIDASIAKQGSAGWGSGPLWDAAILNMRVTAGGLAQDLENLQLLGADVIAQLTPEVRGQYDEQLRAIKQITDEIHTDKGGVFVDHLKGFHAFGTDVASQLKALLAKADEAEAQGAVDAVKGAEVLDWNLATEPNAKVLLTETERVAGKVQSAGGR